MRAQEEADARLARSLAAEERQRAAAHPRLQRRGPSLQHRHDHPRPGTRDELARPRCAVIACCVFDEVALLALLLQLTSTGFPHSLEELEARFSDPGLPREFWFGPAIAASAIPLATLIVGVCWLRTWACWVYVCFVSALACFRAYLLFEMSHHVESEERLSLAIDMCVNTACMLAHLYAAHAAAHLALLHEWIEAAKQLGPASELPERPGTRRAASSRGGPVSATRRWVRPSHARGRQGGASSAISGGLPFAAPASSAYGGAEIPVGLRVDRL